MWTPQNSSLEALPPSVNWHFWPWCNYACTFCFAHFDDLPKQDRLSKEQALKMPQMLADAGATKITFVGGEPTLCPYLGELLEAAKIAGLTTCIVSNGTGLSEEFLETWHHCIDWIGLSIDASNDVLHAQIGRGLKRDLREQRSSHLADSLIVWNRCVRYGIRMKLNTVINAMNLEDDMSELVLELQPERWKIFQVLPVEGQNDGLVDPLLIDESEFDTWVERHRHVVEKGIDFVPESNDLMRASYAMMDALGRFYTNVNGGHEYTNPVMDIGVLEAWSENCFLEERFLTRGGIYNWATTSKMERLDEVIQ
jgi:radical S-adenosyl methionine domain-containing protein 2